MTDQRAGRAREVWRLIEPIHAVTYFSPEPVAALKAAGYRGYWMGYFAGRAAPLGAVSPEVVHALFYNFTFDHVARALPDAWGFAPPEAALAARVSGTVAALRRQLGDLASSSEVETAAEIASGIAAGAPMEGRALYAANRALPQPDEPLARLWHATTLLREHRGDGHVAALTSAGVGGRESHALNALSNGVSRTIYETARNLHADEWAALVDGLRERGLVDGAGALTAAGRQLKQSIEDQTDALAWTAYAALPAADVERLLSALRPIAAAVIASGDLPAESPVGMILAETPTGSDGR